MWVGHTGISLKLKALWFLFSLEFQNKQQGKKKKHISSSHLNFQLQLYVIFELDKIRSV